MTDEPRSNMPAMLASGVVLGVHRGWIRAIDVGSLVALLGLLIALALRLQGFEPSAEFGVAPSTLAYWRQTA